MSTRLSIDPDGGLTISTEGPSLEAAITQMRELVPDIDRMVLETLAPFRSGPGPDPDLVGVPKDDSRQPDEPEPDTGTAARPWVPSVVDGGDDQGGVEDEAQHAEGPELGTGGEVDTGEGVAPGADQEPDASALICEICKAETPPDWADLMQDRHGTVLCPAHGTL